MRLEYGVAAGDFTRAGYASSSIKKTLKQLGVSSSVVRRVVIAVYEAEVNIVAHGPGIADIALAMREGYSTAPDNIRNLGFGAGMGLPNIKENADELEIDTGVGRGTTLRIFIKF